MGWESSSTWFSKKDVAIEVMASLIRTGMKINAMKSTKDGIWYVVENKAGKNFIAFALINKHGGSYNLKLMTEDMGPSYYCCPVSFFDMVDAPKGYAVEWRQKVIELNKRKERELAPGMVIKLYDKVYTIHEKRKHSWTCRGEDGKLYKLTRAQLAQWQEVTKLEQNLAGMV